MQSEVAEKQAEGEQWSQQGMHKSEAGGALTSAAQPTTSVASAGPGPSKELDQLWLELRQRDAQILVLQKKLAHFRSWVASVHAKVQQVNPQAIKNSKRLYVGNLPADTTEDELKQFLNGLMIKTGALASPGSAILSCKITPEKNYAFVEFRSVEETSNAMAFDGVAFRDSFLKVRRPSNYDLATAIMLGPVQPDPTMDTSQLEICRTVVEDSPHKLFVGGLPCEWSEDMVKELLLPYGALKSFNLVMDKSTGKSKGYAFCEFQDESTVDVIIKHLNQRRVGSKALTVKRALEGSKQQQAAAAAAAMQQQQIGGLGGGPGGGQGGPSGGGGGPGGSPANPMTPAREALAKLAAAGTPLTGSPASGPPGGGPGGQGGGGHGHASDSSPSGLQGAFAAFLQQHAASGMHLLPQGAPGTPQAAAQAQAAAAAAAALGAAAAGLPHQDLSGLTPEELAAVELSQQAQGVPPFGLQGLGPGGLGFW